MFCRKCGKEIPDDSDFCRYCGATVKSFETNAQSVQNSKFDISSIVNSDSGKNFEYHKEELNRQIQNSNGNAQTVSSFLHIAKIIAITSLILAILFAWIAGDPEDISTISELQMYNTLTTISNVTFVIFVGFVIAIIVGSIMKKS